MTRRRDVRAICFDAAGTLFRPRYPVGAIYARYAVKHGLPSSPDLEAILEARFREQFAAMTPPAYRPGASRDNTAVDRAWWRQLVANVVMDLGPVDFDAFFDEVYEAFGDPANWCTYAETMDVLSRLRAAGLSLAIVSNFDARLLRICRGLQLDTSVDVVVYSAATGISKPDPGIFRYTLDRLGTPAHATVHVGDSLREDVAGARAAGLHAVHLRRNDTTTRHAPTDDSSPIAELTELLTRYL